MTRKVLPQAALDRRDWPVRFDHCFQRILLDNAAGAVWYDVIEGRPAYRYASVELLDAAIELGERVMTGEADLGALNAESLRLRGKGAA
ncbi:MAG: GCN5-related N-acetyltransferase [Pseudomonadota bacterium]